MYINKAFKIAFALKSVVLMHIAVKIKKKKKKNNVRGGNMQKYTLYRMICNKHYIHEFLHTLSLYIY